MPKEIRAVPTKEIVVLVAKLLIKTVKLTKIKIP